jgi:hypothetical protein
MPGVAPIIPGLPGVRTPIAATARAVFRNYNFMGALAQGRYIDGVNARDPDNTGDTDRLRVGLLMGKITSTGLYANSVIGLTAAAYTSGATSITVTPQCAAEIVRRIGSSGTLNYIGPPSAGGTVAILAIAYSAVNVTTGVITTTSLGANLVTGSLVCANDGSQTPVTFIPETGPWGGYAIPVTDESGNNITVQFPIVPIVGEVDPTMIVNYPADTSTQAWVKTQLNNVGKYVFNDNF